MPYLSSFCRIQHETLPALGGLSFPRWVQTTLLWPECVYTEDHSHPSTVVTVPKPRHPLDPWSLCAPVQLWEVSPPITTLRPSLPSLPFPLPSNQPPSSFILLTSTPFLTHQPPSSPCSYPTALPSRSIPQAVHTEAYCVCAGRRQKAVYSQSTREKLCVELKWTQYSCCILIDIWSWSCSGIQWHCSNIVLKTAVADEHWMIAPQRSAVLLFWD